MPQEFHVLQCYNCETFQVHMVKKVPHWECKMCGEKQSTKKVYGTGTGKDCRLFVQSLNEQRLTSQLKEPRTAMDCPATASQNLFNFEAQNSKWVEFVDTNSQPSRHAVSTENCVYDAQKAEDSKSQFCDSETKIAASTSEEKCELEPCKNPQSENVFEEKDVDIDSVLTV